MPDLSTPPIADALMLRSDLAMYRAKPADPATAVALDLHATVALPTRQ